jgi:hypothetical protein
MGRIRLDTPCRRLAVHVVLEMTRDKAGCGSGPHPLPPLPRGEEPLGERGGVDKHTRLWLCLWLCLPAPVGEWPGVRSVAGRQTSAAAPIHLHSGNIATCLREAHLSGLIPLSCCSGIVLWHSDTYPLACGAVANQHMDGLPCHRRRGSAAPSALASVRLLLARLAYGENRSLHRHITGSVAPVATSPSFT